ncbi:MAG: serine hydrolase domain-containing protein [Acidobacteriaceae bacterium]
MRTISVAALYIGFLFGFAAAAENSQQRVDQIFAAYDKTDSPGCALGVIRDGAFIYRRGYGAASLELRVPLSPASVFYMGSVSKQFTAASVVLAAEQGFLSLDDDIRKYIPELPDYGHTITLRQMLHHTSGFRDFLTLLSYSGGDASAIHSDKEIIDLIARQKGLNNVPGDEFIYSNTNYYLLGEVLKRATGKSLAEFASENIFRPLGMGSTRYYDDHSVVLPGRVSAYDTGAGGKFLVDWSTSFDIVGAGGLMSSVDDLLLWDSNFYNNRLGKGTLLKELQTPGVLNSGKPIAYALGLELGAYRGLSIVEHDGALYGYRTAILRFPEQRFTVLCLCNLSSANTWGMTRKVADIYLEKSLGPAAGAGVTSNTPRFPDPAPFAGKYLDPRNHSLYSFTSSGGKLMAWGADLRQVGPNQFNDLGTGTITFDGSGGNMSATLVMDGDTFFAGKRIEDLHLTNAQLATYTGRFRSAEVGAVYTLSIEGGSLLLRLNWNPPLKLNPIATDQFENEDLGTIIFQRNASQQVSGLSLSSARARGVLFQKTD